MIKFGLLTAILDGWTYEEAVDIAADLHINYALEYLGRVD